MGTQGAFGALAGQQDGVVARQVDIGAPDEVVGSRVGAESAVGQPTISGVCRPLTFRGQQAGRVVTIEGEDLAGELGDDVGVARVMVEDEMAGAAALGSRGGRWVERRQMAGRGEGILGDAVFAQGHDVEVVIGDGDAVGVGPLDPADARTHGAGAVQGPRVGRALVVEGASQDRALWSEAEVGHRALGGAAFDPRCRREGSRAVVEAEGVDARLVHAHPARGEGAGGARFRPGIHEVGGLINDKG